MLIKGRAFVIFTETCYTGISKSPKNMSKKLKKILIIEDEKPIGNALKLKLQKEGFEAELVSNGEEGLKQIKKKKYDLLILDIVMPKMDGFDFLEEVQNKKFDSPIIISSNLSQPEDMEKAKNLGASEFFVKSDISLSEIVSKIKKYL